MIPPAKGGGRRRWVNVREVLNGIFYFLWTGCQWKVLPKDLPPKSTCMTISNCGTETARWSASTPLLSRPCAGRPIANSLLTHRASKNSVRLAL